MLVSVMDFNAHSLLCCEEMIGSPWSEGPSPPAVDRSSSEQELSSFHPGSCGVIPLHAAVDDDAVTIDFLLEKQLQYLPDKCYLSELQTSQMCTERCRAVRWLLKAHSIFNFSPLTAALAVNYFDRYLGQNLALSWKPWMLELLSVACLSIAAKMEEIDVPALLDLQIDGMEHSFHGATVQRMELAVMNGLDWKLRSVTPFAFAEKAISCLDVSHHAKNLLLERVSELLLGTLPELEFLDFQPSVMAVSSICCALEESVPVQADVLKAWLLKYIPSSEENAVGSCCSVLEELVVDPLCGVATVSLSGHLNMAKSPPSPTGVLVAASAAAVHVTSSVTVAAEKLNVVDDEEENDHVGDLQHDRGPLAAQLASNGADDVMNAVTGIANCRRRLLESRTTCVRRIGVDQLVFVTTFHTNGGGTTSAKRQRRF